MEMFVIGIVAVLVLFFLDLSWHSFAAMIQVKEQVHVVIGY